MTKIPKSILNYCAKQVSDDALEQSKSEILLTREHFGFNLNCDSYIIPILQRNKGKGRYDGISSNDTIRQRVQQHENALGKKWRERIRYAQSSPLKNIENFLPQVEKALSQGQSTYTRPIFAGFLINTKVLEDQVLCCRIFANLFESVRLTTGGPELGEMTPALITIAQSIRSEYPDIAARALSKVIKHYRVCMLTYSNEFLDDVKYLIKMLRSKIDSRNSILSCFELSLETAFLKAITDGDVSDIVNTLITDSQELVGLVMTSSVSNNIELSRIIGTLTRVSRVIYPQNPDWHFSIDSRAASNRSQMYLDRCKVHKLILSNIPMRNLKICEALDIPTTPSIAYKGGQFPTTDKNDLAVRYLIAALRDLQETVIQKISRSGESCREYLCFAHKLAKSYDQPALMAVIKVLATAYKRIYGADINLPAITLGKNLAKPFKDKISRAISNQDRALRGENFINWVKSFWSNGELF